MSVGFSPGWARNGSSPSFPCDLTGEPKVIGPHSEARPDARDLRSSPAASSTRLALRPGGLISSVSLLTDRQGALFESLSEAFEQPQAVLEKIIGALVGRDISLTTSQRKSNLLALAPLFPGLPMVLMRRYREEGDLWKSPYWTLLGPWGRGIYDMILALPPKNDQEWEAVGVARPFSLVHGGMVAPNFKKIGGGPQVLMSPEDVILLAPPHRNRLGAVAPHHCGSTECSLRVRRVPRGALGAELTAPVVGEKSTRHRPAQFGARGHVDLPLPSHHQNGPATPSR